MNTAERALKWALSDDTGSSSIAICTHMISGIAKRGSHPQDPDDLGRCLRLLFIIPEWTPRIAEMAAYGPGWAGLVARWDEIAALMADEVGIDWSKGRGALRTYEVMQLAIADGYRRDPRYECTFGPDGTLRSCQPRRET